MVSRGSIAVVAERQNFYSAGLAAMLHREVGFTQVVLAHDYSELTDILSFGISADFLALDFDLPFDMSTTPIMPPPFAHPEENGRR